MLKNDNLLNYRAKPKIDSLFLIMARILIAGGRGFIGKRLTALLKQCGHEVSHLSRDPSPSAIKTYYWNIEKRSIDPEAIENADYIVNLAGESVANGRWTAARKKLLIDSRVDSISLLAEALQKRKTPVKAFISASATGWYGDAGSEQVDESRPPGHDFLGRCCTLWEHATAQVKNQAIRTAIVRIGIVLAKHEGIIPVLANPARLRLSASAGNGRQYVSWIHLDDVCHIFLKAIEDEHLSGIYNATAPGPVTYADLIHTMGNILGKPVWIPSIPAPLLKLVLGEKASLILNSANVSSKKIQDAGYVFRYTELRDALKACL